MDKAVGFLAKAVTATAASAFVLAGVLMFYSRSLTGLPLLILGVIAFGYSFRLAKADNTDTADAPELRQRILVS